MDRFTVKGINGSYSIADDDVGKAVHKLGLFEDAYDELFLSIERIPSELEAMRVQGKEKTVRYKETLAQKLIYNNIAAFFEQHGLKQGRE